MLARNRYLRRDSYMTARLCYRHCDKINHRNLRQTVQRSTQKPSLCEPCVCYHLSSPSHTLQPSDPSLSRSASPTDRHAEGAAHGRWLSRLAESRFGRGRREFICTTPSVLQSSRTKTGRERRVDGAAGGRGWGPRMAKICTARDNDTLAIEIRTVI